jgi:hypothetical protein
MRNRLAFLLAWAAVGGTAGGATAQWATERWVSLVEMPVAVTRLELAGFPLADLRLFVPALNVREVQPMLFLETVRGVPVMQHYYVLDDYDVGVSGAHPVNHGGYVQYLLSRGLRGTALADAIHGDLGSRGIVARSNRARGVDVLSDDYVLVPVGGSLGGNVGRGQVGEPGARGRGASEANGRARSLGDDLRARKGGAGGGRPALEPRGRGGSSVSPANPGRGGSSSPAVGRGRGGDAGGGNASGGGRGGGGGRGQGGGGRGRGG